MYNHCDRPGSTCPSRPNSKGHSHCWPRTKGGLWLWRLVGICTIAGAESPFFLLVLRHRAGGVLPAPHTTGLSLSRLQARAEQCQSTSTKHTHTQRESRVLLDDSLSISIKQPSVTPSTTWCTLQVSTCGFIRKVRWNHVIFKDNLFHGSEQWERSSVMDKTALSDTLMTARRTEQKETTRPCPDEAEVKPFHLRVIWFKSIQLKLSIQIRLTLKVAFK